MAKSIDLNLRNSLYNKIIANSLINYVGISEADMYKLFNLDDKILRAIDACQNIPSLKYSILIVLKIAYYMSIDEVLEIIGLIRSIDEYQEYKMESIYSLLDRPMVLKSGNFLQSAKFLASCQAKYIVQNALRVLTSSFLIDAKKQFEAAEIIKSAKERHNADCASKVLLNKTAQENSLAFTGARIIAQADNICASETILMILTELEIINNVDVLKAANIIKDFSCNGAELAKKVFSNKELVHSPFILDVVVFLGQGNPYDMEGYVYSIFSNPYLFDLKIAFDMANLVKNAKSGLNARYICDLAIQFSFIPNIPPLLILESAKSLKQATSDNELANMYNLLTNRSLIEMGLTIISAKLIATIKDSKLQDMATAILQNEYFVNMKIAMAFAKIIAEAYTDSDIELITTACENPETLSRVILEVWQMFCEDSDKMETIFNILSNLFGIDFTFLISRFFNHSPVENIEVLQRFVTSVQRMALKRSLKRKDSTSTNQFSIF